MEGWLSRVARNDAAARLLELDPDDQTPMRFSTLLDRALPRFIVFAERRISACPGVVLLPSVCVRDADLVAFCAGCSEHVGVCSLSEQSYDESIDWDTIPSVSTTASWAKFFFRFFASMSLFDSL